MPVSITRNINLIMQKLSSWFNQLWYSEGHVSWPFAPLSWVYALGQNIDAKFKRRQQMGKSPVPVIVVGNLSLGGSGKTPLVIALVEFFRSQGLLPGVVMRGYKSEKLSYPYHVSSLDEAQTVGDEAALIAQKTQVPLVIHPKRQQAVEALHQLHSCHLIISDDGLQHYAMARNLEIAVIDGPRGFGNGHLFPRGPLREPITRLATVDMIVVNGEPNPKLQRILAPYHDKTFRMHLQVEECQGQVQEPLAAFAGIGHPQRFFQTLTQQGFCFQPYIFPDHHRYHAKDFDIPESSIIMTEKDAIKCKNLSHKPILVLPVTARLSQEFWQRLRSKMRLNENE